MDAKAETTLYAKVVWRLIPLLFLCYIAAFLDRVNVGFAKLQMAGDLALSDAMYGFGAGIFFIGYFLFEVPSNLILQKVGARRWIARIMVSWGVISSCFMFTGALHWGPIAAAFGCTDAEFTFYLLRFLLGVAEAGFFPGVILYLTYWFPAGRRAQMVGLFMSAIALSNLIGSPLSGAIMQYMDGVSGWRGWQWLFLLEGIPSVLMGVVVLFLLPDGPRSARWLSAAEQDFVVAAVDADEAHKSVLGVRHGFAETFADLRVWALALVYFCGAGCLYAANFWMPTIIQELGLAPDDFLRIGLINMIPWGTAAIVMILWSRHSDHTGERRWHAAGGMLVAMVGLLLLAAFGHSAIAAIAALALVLSGTLSWVVTFWSLPTAFLSGTAAAAGIAWINAFGNLGGHFGPDIIGRIRTANNGASEPALLALAAAALIGALVLLALPRTQARAIDEASPQQR
ncbi:nitrate/nitrite transporter [alpha proteobacterium U9-1i]|nr:nitrate/nitrite transporter [alpha proteobacterium U9-1i]